MAFNVIKWAYGQPARSAEVPDGLTGTERAVLLCLAFHAHPDGTESRPGLALQSEETSFQERAIRKTHRSLEAKGLIEATAYPNGGAGHATVWRCRLETQLSNAAPRATFNPAPNARLSDDNPASHAKNAASDTENAAPRATQLTEPQEPPITFDQFWKAYPARNGHKGSKKNAKTAWGRLSVEKRAHALQSLPAYRQAKGDFPKDAERYLRGEEWEGLVATSPAKSTDHQRTCPSCGNLRALVHPEGVCVSCVDREEVRAS